MGGSLTILSSIRFTTVPGLTGTLWRTRCLIRTITQGGERRCRISHAVFPSVLTGIHATADAWIIRKNKSACVIMTNLAMPSHPIQTEELNLRSSAQRFWLAMGELEYLSALQIEQLETASALRKESQPWTQELGTVNLIVTLAPQSVAAHTRIRSTLNQPS